MSRDELVALVGEQAQRISAQDARIAALDGGQITTLAARAAAVVVFTVFLPEDVPGTPTGTVAARSASARSSAATSSAPPASSARVILPRSSPTDSELVGGQTDHLEPDQHAFEVRQHLFASYL